MYIGVDMTNMTNRMHFHLPQKHLWYARVILHRMDIYPICLNTSPTINTVHIRICVILIHRGISYIYISIHKYIYKLYKYTFQYEIITD